MSTVQTPSPVKKSYTIFDLETFEPKTVEREISFTPAGNSSEALERIGNSDETLLKALNAFLQRQAFTEARREVAKLGGSKKIVLSVIKPFRNMAPFNGIFKLDAAGNVVVENGEKLVDRQAQTKALLQMIKANPAMVEAIKNASIAAADEDEDETADEEKE